MSLSLPLPGRTGKGSSIAGLPLPIWTLAALVVFFLLHLANSAAHGGDVLTLSGHERHSATPSDAQASLHSEDLVKTERIVENWPTSHYSDSSLREVIGYIVSLVEREWADREKSLLAPLPAKDEEMLKELGLRTKVFKKAFDVWESLHLYLDEWDGQIHYQQNPIQRLQNLTSFDHNQAVDAYDKFGYIIGRLSKILYPISMPHWSDLMSLHAGFDGRGIVLTGGRDQVPTLVTLITSLRKLGCNLPIEIMHLGEKDINPVNEARLNRLPGVVTRDLKLMIDDAGWEVNGWAVKPFAILLSSFREAIFLDADAFFLSNPETLFESREYRSTGTVFFLDRMIMPRERKSWLEQFLLQPISEKVAQNRMWRGVSEHMQESGVVLVDKWRHFTPLLLAARLNGPRRDAIYKNSLGDKETFWMSWELAGQQDYAFHPSRVGSIGLLRPDGLKEDPPRHKICSTQVIHFDAEGKPLWFNGGLKENKIQKEAGWKKFQSYVWEDESLGQPGSLARWDVEPANTFCLTGPAYANFTESEMEKLTALVESIQEQEALGRG